MMPAVGLRSLAPLSTTVTTALVLVLVTVKVAPPCSTLLLLPSRFSHWMLPVTASADSWMLRSWLVLPPPFKLWVRMCQGAPVICDDPLGAVPTFQKADCARCPPQARRTAVPPLGEFGSLAKWTIMSAVLLPVVAPEWTGTEMLVIVPPKMVRNRVGAPGKVCAPVTLRLLAFVSTNGSRGKANVEEAPKLMLRPAVGSTVVSLALKVARKS